MIWQTEFATQLITPRYNFHCLTNKNKYGEENKLARI